MRSDWRAEASRGGDGFWNSVDSIFGGVVFVLDAVILLSVLGGC